MKTINQVLSAQNEYLRRSRERYSNLLFLTLTVSIIIIVVLLITLAFQYQKTQNTQIAKDYYREQMINFCKLTQINAPATSQGLYPCEKWTWVVEVGIIP